MGFRIRPLVLGAALLALSLSGCNKIGFVYDFARPNTVQTVDQRDAAIILQTRLFRQVQ